MANFYDPATRRSRLLALRSALRSDRASFDSHWREIAEFILPRRTRFAPGDRNKGDKRNGSIIDGTAGFAARTLQSGLHAGLTSPARPWMRLTTPDPTLADVPAVKEWLHLVTQRMLTIFLQTNLYNVLPMVYGDLGVFGTGAMAIVEDDVDLFRAYAYPIGSYDVGLDARGLATMFFREYELSVSQVVEQFGLADDGETIDWSRISTETEALYKGGHLAAPVAILWAVLPNEQWRPGPGLAKYKRWASCYLELGAGDSQAALKESGFDSFPVMVPRWDLTGEDTYGTQCPGMMALGDVKQLQLMQREKAKAIKKMVDPPLVGPSVLRTQKTSMLPGDITYVDVREGSQGLRSVHEINLNLADLGADIRETQYRIQRTFYEDLFLMIAQSERMRGAQPVTAREIEERHEEKLLALGPVLERTNDELLSPLVDRVYLMMDDAGLIPVPPPQIQGVRIKPEYISIMAQAQKLVGVVGADRFMQTVYPMIQILGPAVANKLKINAIINEYVDMLGTDPRMIRTDEEADALGAQQAQAAQAQQQAQQAALMAKAGKDAGTTPMEGDTALNRLVSGYSNQAGGIQ